MGEVKYAKMLHCGSSSLIWVFKKQSITSKDDSEQEFLLAQAFLNRKFGIKASEGFDKRKGKVRRNIFCTPHVPKRLFALKNDLQQQSCVLCMPLHPLQKTLGNHRIVLFLLAMDTFLTENHAKETYPFWRVLVGT